MAKVVGPPGSPEFRLSLTLEERGHSPLNFYGTESNGRWWTTLHGKDNKKPVVELHLAETNEGKWNLSVKLTSWLRSEIEKAGFQLAGRPPLKVDPKKTSQQKAKSLAGTLAKIGLRNRWFSFGSTGDTKEWGYRTHLDGIGEMELVSADQERRWNVVLELEWIDAIVSAGFALVDCNRHLPKRHTTLLAYTEQDAPPEPFRIAWR